MEFIELKRKEYEKYWENSDLKTFLSSPLIGDLRKDGGWETYFVGVKDKKKLIGACMLLGKQRKFNSYEFYSPRGLLLDYKDEKLLNFFVENIKQYVKNKKGYIFRMDPYIIYKERNLDGDIVEGGEDNSNIVDNLIKLGFKKIPDNSLEQVGWMFSLDLEGKSEEDILKGMKPNVRNMIRKAEKIGIDIRELKYDELDEFQNIMIETGKRKGFSIRGINYYQKMYKLFHDRGEVKYFITSLNLINYVKQLEEEKKLKEDQLNNLKDAKYNEGLKNNTLKEISSLEKRISDANNIRNTTKKDIINLSASMFMLIQPEIIYLSSGNYEEYMKFNGQYLIQWNLIKYGIKNGFKKHNFYGIPANINTHPKDYGIYEFKRGFNGYVEELIGEFELPISNKYYLFNIIHKIKNIIK